MGSIADTVRADRATELERLGSDRGLLALTDADLSGGTVRRRIAATDAAVAEVLAEWAAAESGPAATAFESAAGTKRDHARSILDDGSPEVGDDPVAVALTDADGTEGRLGAGLVGYPLVADGRYLQAVNLFVNEADESSADEFRSVRSETAGFVERGESLIDDEEAGIAAATAVVDAAYDAYVASLDALGIDPKTVC